MTIEDQVITKLIANGILEEESSKVRGIAQLAVDKGYASISKPQQNVINHLLTRTCDGVTNPGGHYNECKRVLEGAEFLEALDNQGFYDAILCEACVNEVDGHRAHWERIQAE